MFAFVPPGESCDCVTATIHPTKYRSVYFVLYIFKEKPRQATKKYIASSLAIKSCLYGVDVFIAWLSKFI